jgi:cytochrome c biogenesis factor
VPNHLNAKLCQSTRTTHPNFFERLRSKSWTFHFPAFSFLFVSMALFLSRHVLLFMLHQFQLSPHSILLLFLPLSKCVSLHHTLLFWRNPKCSSDWTRDPSLSLSFSSCLISAKLQVALIFCHFLSIYLHMSSLFNFTDFFCF